MSKEKKISRRQFELLVNAISNGVYYSANPDKIDKIQEIAVEDIKDFTDKEKELYMKTREVGKDLFYTHPKGTDPDDIIKEYVDNFFEFINDGE
jgi:hypothetical protein